jgi:hypothetical protein
MTSLDDLPPLMSRVYAMLKEAGPAGCTTGDFMRNYIASYSQRIGSLNKLLEKSGVRIESERLPGRASWRYWISEE